jgi:hypothetical protein
VLFPGQAVVGCVSRTPYATLVAARERLAARSEALGARLEHLREQSRAGGGSDPAAAAEWVGLATAWAQAARADRTDPEGHVLAVISRFAQAAQHGERVHILE